MGAWAAGILDDDTAMDVLDELKSLPDPRPWMAQAFRNALNAGTVDYEAGHAALVSAALIAHVSAGLELEGLEDLDDNGEVQAWVDGLHDLDFSALGRNAADACDKVIRGDSELRELWAENEALFPQWEAQGVAVVQALTMQRPG